MKCRDLKIKIVESKGTLIGCGHLEDGVILDYLGCEKCPFEIDDRECKFIIENEGYIKIYTDEE